MLESKLNDWLSLAREYCEPSDPSDNSLLHEFKNIIEQYQKKEIILTSEKSALENDLRATQRVSIIFIRIRLNIKLSFICFTTKIDQSMYDKKVYSYGRKQVYSNFKHVFSICHREYFGLSGYILLMILDAEFSLYE